MEARISAAVHSRGGWDMKGSQQGGVGCSMGPPFLFIEGEGSQQGKVGFTPLYPAVNPTPPCCQCRTAVKLKFLVGNNLQPPGPLSLLILPTSNGNGWTRTDFCTHPNSVCCSQTFINLSSPPSASLYLHYSCPHNLSLARKALRKTGCCNIWWSCNHLSKHKYSEVPDSESVCQ